MSQSPHPEPARTGKLLICPYCGDPQPTAAAAIDEVNDRCRTCGGMFEPLSRQATHNAMGPWFVRDPNRSFQPGCSYETLVRLVQRGKITRLSIMRGPTTRQFWTIAKRVPGIAHLLGFCHECSASVDPADHGCHACGMSFGAFLDRNYLGLPEYRPLPWEREQNSDDPRQAMGLTHDDPSARTWHGLPTIREAQPVKGRLSSFATDEELRGEKPIGQSIEQPTSAGIATAAGGESSATVEDNLHAPPAASPQSERSSEVAVRLMRRKVSRQQKTISRLTILSTALGFVALVALMAWIAALTQIRRSALPAASPAVQVQGNADEFAERAEPAVEDANAAEQRSASSPAAKKEPADDAPIAAESEERITIDPRRFAAIHDEFEQAMVLVEASREDGRPLEEAIADCEEAIVILTRIKDEEPTEYWPDGLEKRLAEARRQHERLKLREFFP